MRDEHIAAALRAACIAMCECEGQCYSRGAGNSSSAGICMVPDMDRPAAAVAAFLRAPDMDVEMMLCGTEAIAAAVEQEARSHD